MPPSRTLRWAGLGLAGLLGLAAVGLWLARRDRAPSAAQTPEKETPPVSETITMVGQPQRLVPGIPVAAELKGGEGRTYELDLKAKDYAHVVVEQRGIDIAVQLFGPDDNLRAFVDSPNGRNGPEPLHEVADADGIHRLEVLCSDATAPAARFEVRIEALRPATDVDLERTAAERKYLNAEDLRRTRKKEARLQARELYLETLPVWQKLGLADREADTWFQLGSIARALSDLETALDELGKALALYQQLGQRNDEAKIYNWIGTVHYRLGRHAAALDNHAKAAAAAREVSDHEVEAAALNGTGNVYAARGEVQKALAAYRQARPAAHAAENPHDEGVALYGIGSLLIRQGKLEQALDALQEALTLFRQTGSTREEANALSRIANIEQRRGQLEASRAHLEAALAHRVAEGDRDGEAIDLNSLGTVYLNLHQIEKAGECYRRALTLTREVRSRQNEAFALLNLGRYDFEVGNDRQAVEHHDQAAAVFREIHHLRGEISTLFGSARALHRLGEHQEAHQRLERVLAGVEELRDESESVDLRTGYFGTKQHYYDLHIDVLMHLHEEQRKEGWDAAALRLHERRRARGMLDLLAEAGAQVRRGADPELLARERELEQEIADADRALVDARERGGSKEQLAAIEKLQRQRLLDLDTLRTEIRIRSPRYASLVRPEPLSLPEIQRQVVGEKSLLLVYALGDERSFLWSILRDGGMKSYVLPRRSRIEEAARQAHQLLQERGESQLRKHRLAELSDLLLAPVKAELGDRLLIVVADGALEALPFAALPDPRQRGAHPAPLVAANEVVHLPSSTVLATLRRDLADRQEAPRRLAILADPVFTGDDDRLAGRTAAKHRKGPLASSNGDLARSARDVGVGLDRLPFSAEEARSIAAMIHRDQRLEANGLAASKELVTSGELRRYRVLHFATHGLLNAKNPELSGLVFSLFDDQGKPVDGFLRGYEICNLDLPAELAVLSACQTGLGSEIRGEGLVGLTRSFMYAGVPRIVVSLWKVSDRGTAELMKLFYHGIFEQNLRPSMALRCAQLAMLGEEPWSDPFYWGAFVFHGEWRLQTGSPDDDIEARATGSESGHESDDDLPPPGFLRAAGCPNLR